MARSDRYKEKKKKKMSTGKKVAISIGSIVLVMVLLCGCVFAYGYNKFSKMKQVKLSDKAEDIGITKETEEMIKDKNEVRNILITGIDHDEDATDTMMIVTIDNSEQKIKLASIYRDTYIKNTPEGQVPKLNYAHKYGGIQNTVKVINESFKLDIRDYVNVDYEGFFKIVDIVGGVELDVPAEDIYAINNKIDYICSKDFKDVTPSKNYLKKGGKQQLNTIQTMAVLRYRTSSGDYARTDRNREFIDAMIKKLSSSGVNKMLEVYDTVAPYVETTLSMKDLMSIGTSVVSFGGKEIEQAAFPYDAETIFVDGWNYFGWDEESNIEKIHQFIYE